jgi:hypothetical protein
MCLAKTSLHAVGEFTSALPYSNGVTLPNNVRILEALTTLLLVGTRVIIFSTHIRPRHSQERTPKLRASTVCTPSHEGPANNTSFTSSQRGYQMPDSQRLSHRPSNEEQGMKSKRTKKDRKSPDKAMGTR